jgi:hypothetical protein
MSATRDRRATALSLGTNWSNGLVRPQLPSEQRACPIGI